MSPADRRWNLNIHYHRVVLDAVPRHARAALDIGTGDGVLAFDLADRGLDVVGIDLDAASIARASADPRASDRTHFIVGDVLDCPFEPRSFDVVASVAMLHHIDARAGLACMRELVAAGGVLALVGFARPSTPADHGRAAVGTMYKRCRQLRGRYWEHAAPTAWPPPLSSADMAELVERELPGATFRRLLSGRYGIVWSRSAA